MGAAYARAMARMRPVGEITRGTTNPNRLRRIDRWLADVEGWRLRTAAAASRGSHGPDGRDGPGGPSGPVVVDLGYGASPVTTLELFERLRRVRADVEVVGIEIDPARVEVARPLERPGLSFRLGGFEVPLADGRRPVVVRALNVLRQYDEAQVPAAWDRVCARLAPGGLLVDGTCDELGRRAAWIAVEAAGGTSRTSGDQTWLGDLPTGLARPVSLTLSLRLGGPAGIARPSDVAERLPKALIHRNVPGESIHAFLTDLDRAWERAAPQASFGARQRWLATTHTVREAGWPLLDGPRRWRLGEVSVAWAAVAPRRSPGEAR